MTFIDGDSGDALYFWFSAISEQGNYYQQDFFLARLLLSWSFGLKEQVFLGTSFLAVPVGIPELQASPAPNLGYKGGQKTKNKNNHNSEKNQGNSAFCHS